MNAESGAEYGITCVAYLQSAGSLPCIKFFASTLNYRDVLLQSRTENLRHVTMLF